MEVAEDGRHVPTTEHHHLVVQYDRGLPVIEAQGLFRLMFVSC